MGFDTRIDTFMGEICAILKIRCQDQDQAQEDLLQEGINMHSEKTTIRLVAVDMDGTLLHDDKSISDYTLDVLRRIVKKGVILVPASGRPIGGMKEAVLNNVDGIQYAICSNGAMLMDVQKEKSISRLYDTYLCYTYQEVDDWMQDTFYNIDSFYKNKEYTDLLAVQDTAREVRALKQKGIQVIGIFMGSPRGGQVAGEIFGRELVKIRNIGEFSGAVGRILREVILS